MLIDCGIIDRQIWTTGRFHQTQSVDSVSRYVTVKVLKQNNGFVFSDNESALCNFEQEFEQLNCHIALTMSAAQWNGWHQPVIQVICLEGAIYS